MTRWNPQAKQAELEAYEVDAYFVGRSVGSQRAVLHLYDRREVYLDELAVRPSWSRKSSTPSKRSRSSSWSASPTPPCSASRSSPSSAWVPCTPTSASPTWPSGLFGPPPFFWRRAARFNLDAQIERKKRNIETQIIQGKLDAQYIAEVTADMKRQGRL